MELDSINLFDEDPLIKEGGNDQGGDSCAGYSDLGDTYSELRDDCNDARCAAAMDFSAAAAYYAASSYIFLINF